MFFFQLPLEAERSPKGSPAAQRRSHTAARQAEGVPPVRDGFFFLGGTRLVFSLSIMRVGQEHILGALFFSSHQHLQQFGCLLTHPSPSSFPRTAHRSTSTRTRDESVHRTGGVGDRTPAALVGFSRLDGAVFCVAKKFGAGVFGVVRSTGWWDPRVGRGPLPLLPYR
jgi:hypothetical protein